MLADTLYFKLEVEHVLTIYIYVYTYIYIYIVEYVLTRNIVVLYWSLIVKILL